MIVSLLSPAAYLPHVHWGFLAIRDCDWKLESSLVIRIYLYNLFLGGDESPKPSGRWSGAAVVVNLPLTLGLWGCETDTLLSLSNAVLLQGGKSSLGDKGEERQWMERGTGRYAEIVDECPEQAATHKSALSQSGGSGDKDTMLQKGAFKSFVPRMLEWFTFLVISGTSLNLLLTAKVSEFPSQKPFWVSAWENGLCWPSCCYLLRCRLVQWGNYALIRLPSRVKHVSIPSLNHWHWITRYVSDSNYRKPLSFALQPPVVKGYS